MNPPKPKAAAAIGLRPIELTSVNSGGYKISLVNYAAAEGQLLLLEVGSVHVDITGGYKKGHLANLLEAIAYGDLWADGGLRPIPVRLVLVEPGQYTRQPDEEYLRVMIAGFTTPFGQYCKVLQRSEVSLLPAPVRPVIDEVIGRGARALEPLGREPRIGFSMEARYLSKPIGKRCYFLFADTLECNPNERTLNCTTYISSCYRYTESAIGDGRDLCGKLGAQLIDGMAGVSAAQTNEYVRGNRGAYIVVSVTKDSVYTTHVRAYANGTYHEFNDYNGVEGYRQYPAVNDMDGQLLFEIYRMP